MYIKKAILKELMELAEDLRVPTYRLGIGSPFEEKNRGHNEGQDAAGKRLQKVLKKVGIEIQTKK